VRFKFVVEVDYKKEGFRAAKDAWEGIVEYAASRGMILGDREGEVVLMTTESSVVGPKPHVIVTRGGALTKSKKKYNGMHRKVRGRLLHAEGHEYTVILDQDDPWDIVGWSKKGDVGHWSGWAVEILGPYGDKKKETKKTKKGKKR